MAELIGTAGIKTGLMPSSNGIPYLPSSGEVDDLNTVHEKANKGISVVYAISSTSNKPITNANTIYIHMQRLGAGVVSGSQVICQFCGYTGSLYYRTGHGNGSGIDWQTWKQVV